MSTHTLDYTAPATVSKFMRSEAAFRAIKGPIGSGKSVGCVMEIFRQAMQIPAGPDGIRRSRYAIIRNTRQQLLDTTYKTWIEWVAPGVFGRWKESTTTFFIKFDDVEAEILFRPLDSPEDVQRVLSLELTGAWINEAREIPLEVLEALLGRVGRYPKRDQVPIYRDFVIADTNPPEIDSVWYKILETLPLEEDNPESVMECAAFHQPSGLAPDAENREHLRPNYYEDLARGKTKAWVDTYVKGEYSPSQAGKPVYHNSFRPDRHISNRPLFIDPDLPVIVGFDCGLTPAALFMQMDLDSRVRMLREAAEFDMGMKRFARLRLRPIIKNFFPTNPLVFIGDPSGSRRADSDESSAFKVLKELFGEDGAKVRPAHTNDPKQRIEALEQLFCQYPDGDPLVLIDPSCRRFIEAARSKYRYPRMKMSGVYSENPEKNAWSHLMEGGQYGAMFLLSGRYDPRDFNRTYEDDPLQQSAQAYRPAQREGY